MFGRKKSTTSARQTRLPAQRTENKEFFSYHADRRERSDSPTRQRTTTTEQSTNKRRFDWQQLPVIFAIVCLVISAFYITTLQTNVVLRTNQKNGLLRSEASYREFTEQVLSESLLNRNKLTIDTKRVEERITSQFSELSSVAVSLPLLGHKPVIDLNAEKPAALITSEQGVFALNKNGMAIVKANSSQPIEGLTLPMIRDEAGINIEVGKGVLTSQDVAFITTIVKQFDAKKIGIDSLTLPPLASELHVRVTGQKYFVKFNLLTDARIASGQYFTVHKRVLSGDIKPNEYVDARIEEKVFVK